MRGDLFSVSTCLYGLATAVQPVVNLDYSSYRGTSLPNGVTQWLGIRYAAPPLGDLRFAAPQAPLSTNGTVIDADAHGPTCLGTDKGPPTNESSEDCLFMVWPSIVKKLVVLQLTPFIARTFTLRQTRRNGRSCLSSSLSKAADSTPTAMPTTTARVSSKQVT